jgi:hypothetical protein
LNGFEKTAHIPEANLGKPHGLRSSPTRQRRPSTDSSSSEGSPPTVCKLEKISAKKLKKNGEKPSPVELPTKPESKPPVLPKPKIAEKPKNLPPKPAHLQARAGSPKLQPSPLALRKTNSSPKVDSGSEFSSEASREVSDNGHSFKRAPLATSEDF